MTKLRAAIVSREFPPDVYGGAGVHVEYLSRELESLVDLSVHCFGNARDSSFVHAYPAWDALTGKAPHLAALRTLSTDLAIASKLEQVDVVHTHTWYANFAGHLAKLTYGAAHVMTSHSLEPLRPWKAEQLAGGYAISCFIEKTAILGADAVIAVSRGMRADILETYPEVVPERVHVIHNGIDPGEYRADPATDVLDAHGIDPKKPYAVFVGRITRQKGVVHLLEAARFFDANVDLVLCAGEPDTKELADEFRKGVSELEASGRRVVWIEKMLPRPAVIQILSHARVFVCPSVYEPFGIVNLEAMACEIPVVASAVGGIPEIVLNGDTGYLVRFEAAPGASAGPKDREKFARDFADRVNALARDEKLAAKLGSAGRARVLAEFSWASIAKRTVELYETIRKH